MTVCSVRVCVCTCVNMYVYLPYVHIDSVHMEDTNAAAYTSRRGKQTPAVAALQLCG